MHIEISSLCGSEPAVRPVADEGKAGGQKKLNVVWRGISGQDEPACVQMREEMALHVAGLRVIEDGSAFTD